MAEEILVPTKKPNRIEEIIPYLENIAKPAMSVIFLIPYRTELLRSLLHQWIPAESREEALSSGIATTEAPSLETHRRLAGQNIFPARETLKKNDLRYISLYYFGPNGVEHGVPEGEMAMEPVGLERKLTAILSADVEGYSRLMGEDEAGTIRTLTAYREVMTTLIQQYRGRVVDSPGDNLLAEFASAVDAVESAVAIQRELKTRNAELPANRQMVYRIGINVGDIVVEGERVYGDGVNIAARLESLAEGGGICISGTVYDQVENKLALQFDYLGEQTVKNIPKPVRVYQVLSVPGAVAHRMIRAKRAVARNWGKAALAIAAVVVVGVLMVSNFYWVPSRRPLVVMMDSPHPDFVYDQVIQEASGTNADAINDILADLPIDRQKEAVGGRWHRDQVGKRCQSSPDAIKRRIN